MKIGIACPGLERLLLISVLLRSIDSAWIGFARNDNEVPRD